MNLPAGRYLLLGSIYSEEGPEGGPATNVVKPLKAHQVPGRRIGVQVSAA